MQLDKRINFEGFGGLALWLKIKTGDGHWQNIASESAQVHGPGCFRESLREATIRIYRLTEGARLTRTETGQSVTVKEIYASKTGAMIDMFLIAEDSEGDLYAVPALSIALQTWKRAKETEAVREAA